MADDTKRAFFISFEGGEGSGKSTQLRLLADRLSTLSVDSLSTREPGGSPQSEQIRDLVLQGDNDRWTPMTEALLIAAARAEHVTRVIIPALSKGRWVLCDRFADSSIAYQGAGRGLGTKRIAKLQHLVLGDFKPDLTILLDLPPKLGLARAMEREAVLKTGEDRFERAGKQFHKDIRRAYHKILEQEPDRCKVIDATASIDDIHEAVWGHVTALTEVE